MSFEGGHTIRLAFSSEDKWASAIVTRAGGENEEDVRSLYIVQMEDGSIQRIGTDVVTALFSLDGASLAYTIRSHFVD